MGMAGISCTLHVTWHFATYNVCLSWSMWSHSPEGPECPALIVTYCYDSFCDLNSIRQLKVIYLLSENWRQCWLPLSKATDPDNHWWYFLTEKIPSSFYKLASSWSVGCMLRFCSVAEAFQTAGCAMFSHAPHESLYYACKRLFDELNSVLSENEIRPISHEKHWLTFVANVITLQGGVVSPHLNLTK